MIEVEFSYSTSSKWMASVAESFGKATGLEVEFRDNSLHFPSRVMEGRYEYYELNESSGLLLMDCIFFEDILFRKKKMDNNDMYSLLFQVCKDPLILTMNDGSLVNTGHNLIKSVSLSSHEVDASTFINQLMPLRVVIFMFHRSWGILNLFEDVSLHAKKASRFSNTIPARAFAHFDLMSFELVNEMLNLDPKRPNFIQLQEGYSCQLASLFFDNLKKADVGFDKRVPEEEMRIIELTEMLEQNLSEMLTLPKAAEACLMSRSKFASMFNAIFQKNFGVYFLEKKMAKAKELIEKGFSITDVGYQIGYNNIGHFAKTFKDHFGVLPGTYRSNLKADEEDN